MPPVELAIAELFAVRPADLPDGAADMTACRLAMQPEADRAPIFGRIAQCPPHRRRLVVEELHVIDLGMPIAGNRDVDREAVAHGSVSSNNLRSRAIFSLNAKVSVSG
jgi:hypothetical protein